MADSFNLFVLGSITARPTNKISGLRENVTLRHLISSLNNSLIDNYNQVDRTSEISFDQPVCLLKVLPLGTQNRHSN